MPSIWPIARKSLIPLLVLSAVGVGFVVASSGAATSTPSVNAPRVVPHATVKPHVTSAKSGLQVAYYETNPITVPAGEFKGASPVCPRGYEAISGFVHSNSPKVSEVESAPEFEKGKARAWSTVVNNQDSKPGQMQAGVVCAR